MTQLLRRARVVEIADAGHDVHLDQPGRWRTAVEDFVAQVG
jgi:pimeloyl-ACP methyl ester carboxylesterase